MSETVENNKHNRSPQFAALGYLAAASFIFIAWQMRETRLIVAADGLGYVLGIVGASMMVLLLLYPMRKRASFMRQAGPIRHWFRAHMMLGVVGPMLVLVHSNFSLGSINSQVALFCTMVVAGSGVIGRYLYAKIHNGMYGQRLTFDAVRTEIQDARKAKALLGSIMPILNGHLHPLEDEVGQIRTGSLSALLVACKMTLQLPFLRYRIKRDLKEEIERLADESEVVRSHHKRLLVSTFRYLSYRLSVLLKFAQLQACERLFSWWHVVHYPLFIVMVVAAIVHVIAVHMY